MSTTAVRVKGPNKALFRSTALVGSALFWGGLGYLALTYVPHYRSPIVVDGPIVDTYTPPKPKIVLPPPTPPPEIVKQKPLVPIVTQAPAQTEAKQTLTNRQSKSNYANPLPSDLQAGLAPSEAATSDGAVPLISGREWEEPIVATPAIELPAVIATPPAPTPTPKLVVNPVRITGTNPVFPDRALERGISGQVTLSFTVSATGQVENIEVTGEEPRGNGFARAARQAIQSWTFQPQTIDGVPVAYPARYTISFNLED